MLTKKKSEVIDTKFESFKESAESGYKIAKKQHLNQFHKPFVIISEIRRQFSLWLQNHPLGTVKIFVIVGRNPTILLPRQIL